MKRRVMIAVLILGAIALGAGLLAAVPRLPDRGTSVPTAKLMKGPLLGPCTRSESCGQDEP
jgi:hypothetical protein